MTSYRYLVVTLICFSAISADEHETLCLTSLGKHPFDMGQFSGTWYVVAKVKSSLEEHADVSCAKINYDNEDSHVHIVVTLKTSDGSEKTMEGKGEANGASSVMEWKFSEEDKSEDAVHFNILASDYKTYALSHSCREATDSSSKIRYDSIWSREPSMDPVVLKTLQSVMSSLDIVDDDWDIVDNSGC